MRKIEEVSIIEMPPVGFYLAREAGRLAGVSGDRIGQWARRGYIRSSQSSESPRVYAYQDVAEAMVVHELVLRRVAFPSIMAAIDRLRSGEPNGWPLSFAVARESLQVPRRAGSTRKRPRRRRTWEHIVVIENTEARSGAGVLEEVDLESIASDLSRGGWAVRDLPDLSHIEVDPDRLSGRPVIRGSRVSAEFAAGLAANPEGRLVLRNEYDLDEDEIDDAQRWWEVVQRYELAG